MKKLIFIGLLVLVFAIGGGMYIQNQRNTQPQRDVVMVKEVQTDMTGKITPGMDTTEQAGRYKKFSSEVMEMGKDKKRVLFFYASWCPTCRPADSDFTKNIDNIPEDIVVIRVNYNDPDTDADEKKLAETYGITYQHTFVQIDSLGKEVTKWNGGQFQELLLNSK